MMTTDVQVTAHPVRGSPNKRLLFVVVIASRLGASVHEYVFQMDTPSSHYDKCPAIVSSLTAMAVPRQSHCRAAREQILLILGRLNDEPLAAR